MSEEHLSFGIGGGSPVEGRESGFSSVNWYMSSVLSTPVESSSLDVDFDWYLNDLSNPETGPHTPDSPEASAESGTSDSQSLASIIDGGSASFELPLPEDQPTSSDLRIESQPSSASLGGMSESERPLCGSHLHPEGLAVSQAQSAGFGQSNLPAPIPVSPTTTSATALSTASLDTTVASPQMIPPGYVNISPVGATPIYKMQEMPYVVCPLDGCGGTFQFYNYHAARYVIERHSHSHPDLVHRLQTETRRGGLGETPKVICPICENPHSTNDFGRHLLTHIARPPNYWCQICHRALYRREAARFKNHVERCSQRQRDGRPAH